MNCDPAVDVKPRYNVLRHAGAIYALDARSKWRFDRAAEHAAIRAAQFLKLNCVGPIPGHGRLLGVWSRPELDGTRKPEQVKLGGVALGLVALLCVERMKPGSTPLDVLRALARTLVAAQREDGSFRSIFIPSRGGWQKGWTSQYYPGQAVLGLLMLNEYDPSPTWAEAAARGATFLAQPRAAEEEAPPDHWTLLALRRLLSIPESSETHAVRADLIRHAARTCERMLSEQRHRSDDPAGVGGFSKDGRTTPTSTRLEGLLAALDYVGETDAELAARIHSSVRVATGFLLRARIRSGPYEGGVPRAIRHRFPAESGKARGFNRRAGEVRIDYVQHALCAMIQYSRCLSACEPRASTIESENAARRV